MLILAGVSINAVVGDNGIIGKAQDSVFLSSCAYLEDYFNDLYATCAIDGNDNGETPLDTIKKNGYENYFFRTSEGSCLKKNYTNEETGESQTLVLYLVQKDQLPEEVRKQLKGGDGLESRDYRKLRGVYGITSDLKAYYCENGIDTMLGLNSSDLNADSPDIVYADENSVLAQILNGGTAPVTNQNLKSIKTLTIDSADKLTLLSQFDKFQNLTTVYFTNLTIENLQGIEGATQINYIKFINCNVGDYSAMNGLSNLNQLYLVKPAGKNEEIARLGSTDKGIASGEFSNLQYFGILGNETYLNSTSTSYASDRYDITDISPIGNFTDTTKQAIKYMNLQNLQITSISALSGFTNMYLIRLEENALTALDGIQNMSSLKYLIAPCQYSNALSQYTLGINEGANASDTDALKYIYKNESNANPTLYYVDLRNNQNLKYVYGLKDCSGLRYCYLAGCSCILDATQIANELGKCGANYSIEGKYGLDIISDTTAVLSLAGKTMTISEFEQLMNRTSLTHLSLNSIVLTKDDGVKLTQNTLPTFNEEINKVLKTCKNLQYLQLYGLTYLTSLDFATADNCSKLIELDLRQCNNLIDLTNLNSNTPLLTSLYINNSNINLSTIQPALNRCNKTKYYWAGKMRGLVMTNWNLWKQLESCSDLEYFRYYADVAGITNGKSLDLSKTKLKIFEGVYAFCTIKFPNTVTSLFFDYCAVPLFSPDTNLLTEFTQGGNRKLSSESAWEECMKSLANVTNLNTLKIENAYEFKFDSLKYLSGLSNLKYFHYTGWNQKDSTYRAIEEKHLNCNGISNLQQVTEIKLGEMYLFDDLSDIGNCSNLEKFTCYSTKVGDITSISNLKNLKYLDLSNNNISDIYALKNCVKIEDLCLKNNNISDIYPLMNCTKLETLNIQNNALNDFSYYKNENGQSVGYEVMDVFYDLNHAKKGALKNLYISGNNFDDTEILLDLEWSGKSGF